MTNEMIAVRLKELREQRGLSKARLAREAGISDAYLVQIEKGQRTPSDDVLRKLSKALGLHPLHLAAEFGHFYVSDHLSSMLNSYADAVQSGDHARIADAAKAVEADLQWDGLTSEGKPTEDSLWDGLEDYLPPPEGWNRLHSGDRQLVQRLISRLLESGDYCPE